MPCEARRQHPMITHGKLAAQALLDLRLELRVGCPHAYPTGPPKLSSLFVSTTRASSSRKRLNKISYLRGRALSEGGKSSVIVIDLKNAVS